MFTHAALCDAIDAVHQDRSVATIVREHGGSNHGYRVTLEDGAERFLKVGTRFPEAFSAEPKTMERVRRETDVPVPRVYGTGTDPLGYPFAVYELVPDVETNWLGECTPETIERVCREAGRYLDSLHGIHLEKFGSVDLTADGTLAVVDPYPYRELLRHSLDRQLAELRETPFAGRADSLEALGNRLCETIAFDRIRPSLVHGDYRRDNLCLDPAGDRVTAAVLDWERPTAADPLWDAVQTQVLLTDGYRVDPDSRRSARIAFWRTYGGVPDDTPRLRYYELLARMRLARHLETELANAPEAAVTDRIREHDAAFDRLLDGHSLVLDLADSN